MPEPWERGNSCVRLSRRCHSSKDSLTIYEKKRYGLWRRIAASLLWVHIVLVWRYVRFARSTKALINALNEFKSLGVDFISYQENVDTTTPQGELIFTIMASLAQFESSLISQRVKAGMERAKADGKRTSRPTISPTLQRKIAELVKENVSIKQISRDLDIAYATAYKYVKGVR